MDEAARLADGSMSRKSSVALETLLCEWQATGDHAALEEVIRSAKPIVAMVVGRVLFHRGVRDPAALDDAMALVFNHLRRLPGSTGGEPAVARFDPGRGTAADHGRAYLQRLAHDRALDVARRRRREARQAASFSALDDATATELPEWSGMATITTDAEEREDLQKGLLHEAIAWLDARERQFVGLLIEGKSQAVIAHVLDVCEGTVSRMRGRVIAKLQRAIQTRPCADRAETPAPPAPAARRGRAPVSPHRDPPEPSAPA